MRRAAIAAAFLLSQCLPCLSGDGAAIVADLSLKAMAKGYGATCSLGMEPVRSGGYYPCLDFGPYRVVKEYGRVTGYVVREGKKPFLVMTYAAGGGGPGFIEGPWGTDMPARIVAYWSDVVEGGVERARMSGEAALERRAVEEYVRQLGRPTPPAVDPDQPSPDVGVGAASPATGGVMDAIGGETERPR